MDMSIITAFSKNLTREGNRSENDKMFQATIDKYLERTAGFCPVGDDQKSWMGYAEFRFSIALMDAFLEGGGDGNEWIPCFMFSVRLDGSAPW